MAATTKSWPDFASRGLQMLFGIVVLGIAITLLKGHKQGALPASLAFAAVTGAVSVVAAGVCLAASRFDFIHEQLVAVIDGVVFLLNTAGGIFLAIKLKGVSCKIKANDYEDAKDMFDNNILCGGGVGHDMNRCYYATIGEWGIINRRCRQATADSAFMFLTALTLGIAAALAFLRMKKGR
ncbi:hypothetical protein ACN47E_006335 [Coniothyrium glycines]